MKFLQGVTITLITGCIGFVAYDLCMTVATFGGWLPMVTLTAGPAIGYTIARATS